MCLHQGARETTAEGASIVRRVQEIEVAPWGLDQALLRELLLSQHGVCGELVVKRPSGFGIVRDNAAAIRRS